MSTCWYTLNEIVNEMCIWLDVSREILSGDRACNFLSASAWILDIKDWLTHTDMEYPDCSR